MDIVQNFYDNLATQYDKLFMDWQTTVLQQAELLQTLFVQNGYDKTADILDCACGIGTQAVGLAKLGFPVTGSDISEKELAEAERRAADNGVSLRLVSADFCALDKMFEEKFDIMICMDNALPHMLTREALQTAVESIIGQLAPGGMFVASIRDYDAMLENKPSYSPPYIHRTENGQRVSFQTWTWEGEIYRLTQYIIEDENTLQVSKFDCAYRAVRREELTQLLQEAGCRSVEWKFPEETGFYQPIVLAKK